MDSIIKIQLPRASWRVQTTTTGDAIISRITILIKVSETMTVSVVIDCCWFSISAWEEDMRSCLEQLVNERNAIVESRIISTGTTATEQRVQEVLNQILIDEADDN